MFNSETTELTILLNERCSHQCLEEDCDLLCMWKSGWGNPTESLSLSEFMCWCVCLPLCRGQCFPTPVLEQQCHPSQPYLCPISASLLSCTSAPGAPAPALTRLCLDEVTALMWVNFFGFSVTLVWWTNQGQLMTQKRREAVLEENKQEGADNVLPKARMNGEKGDLKRKWRRFFFCSCPCVFETKFVQNSKGNYATSPCNFLLSTVFPPKRRGHWLVPGGKTSWV